VGLEKNIEKNIKLVLRNLFLRKREQKRAGITSSRNVQKRNGVGKKENPGKNKTKKLKYFFYKSKKLSKNHAI